ncbi:MAG: YeiH family protein [Rhodospirillum sp.]|nr:YeiH family protein [Rhodospirillum sp.]MCF8489124.1 YeiH family protein [Rhodospirillum sp.]MCF8498914.1 YeiH family protein [Rhodospirillum sp.]
MRTAFNDPFASLDRHAVRGVILVALFAFAAQRMATFSLIQGLGLSPLIVGIMIGIFYGNTLRHHLPTQWVPGILFSSKQLLRLAVVLYGFRITFQDILLVGGEGITLSVVMLTSTFVLGAWLGIKVFGLTPRLALMIAAGSSVCGAAAVLATEPVVKGRPHESVIAVGTVVIFGTLAMFLYPLAYRSGLLDLDSRIYGLYVGSSLHEVAHVVAAGRAIADEAANNAVIVKMLRVMMLVPLLTVLGLALTRFGTKADANDAGEGAGVVTGNFPWFALWFIVCAGINSLHIVPPAVVAVINTLDLFVLTMAMCALGMETNLTKVRKVGAKPFVMALVLALWLAIGGYWMTLLVHHVWA